MIREVREDDAAQIADIYNHYVVNTTVSFETTPLTVGQMLDRIRSISAAHPYYVYEEEGEISGYCYVHPWKDRPAYGETMETTIYLRPGASRRGLGRQLMERLIPECRRRGYKVLIACITAENIPSCRFHERLGFRRVSYFERVGFKLGRYLDVTDYELVLS